MKLSKCKSLIILVGIVVALLAGSSYLFLQEAKTENPETPSTAAVQSGTPSLVANRPGGIPGEDIKPEKPQPPAHQAPSVTATSPATAPEPPPEPEHQLPALTVSRPASAKEPAHEESEVPIYTGPTLATGDDCNDPIVVSLPAGLPYSDLSQTTCGRMNDYDDPDNTTCLYYYDSGEDIIYELSVSSAVDVDITMDPKGTTWSGIAVDAECPPDADCIAYVRNSGSSPRVMTGVHLEPGTYYIMIDTWASPDCIEDFDLTIVEAAPPPPNDDCENAEAIGDVMAQPWSTTLASFDGQGTCMTSPNIWYCYTATCTGDVTVSLCGSGFDTKLAVYDGCVCDPISPEIGCNDDCCGTRSHLTFAAVEGNQYLIEVGGYSGTGDGILTIECHTPGAPPANDECENAIAISPPDCPSVLTVSGTTKDATVDCPGVLDWEAVWYEFELTYAWNKVYVDYCPTNDPRAWTRGVVLYDECPVECENFILYTDFAWVTCPSGYTDLTVWWENLPAGTYYLPVYVADCDDNPMDFDFDICVEEMEGPQPGDNCASPIAVSLNKAEGDTLYMDLGQTTCGRADDYDATCLGYYDGGEDIIYEVTVSSYVRVNIALDPKATTYTGICIDDACPPADPCMAFSTSSSAAVHGMMGIDLDPGTYYIMVDTWPSPDCIPEFDLVITEASMAPDNDECTGAPVISTFPSTVSGTTIGAGIDCPGVLDWNAVWYQFDLPYECNDLYIDFCPTTDSIWTVGVVVYGECPPDCPNYILRTGYQWTDPCPNGYMAPQIWWDDLPGPASYWFPVYIEDETTNPFLDFTFEVSVAECPPPEPGDNCASPIVVSLNKGPGDTLYSDLGQTTCGRGNYYSATCLGSYDGGEDIIYEVNVSSSVGVDIILDPKTTTYTGICIDDVCPPGATCMAYHTQYSAGPHGVYGVQLDPGTYYIMVDTWPAPDCIPEFDLHIIEAAGPPDNDDCANAEAIGDVTNLPFSTTQATFDGPGHCQTAPNIWYCYTAPCSGNVVVSLCGSGYDTKLAVYDTCVCYPLYEDMIECNDDFCGLQSQITVYDVRPDDQFLIEVGGYSSNTGTGVLTCSCFVPPPGPENDTCQGAPVISTFPTTVYGTTVGATIDCPGVLDWDAVWYRFDVPYGSNNILVDFCPTDGYIWTVGIVLYDECPPECPGYIIASGYQWVTCPSGYDNPQIWWDEMPGPASYWFPVYVIPGKGKDPMDFGFEVSVEEAVPCTIACPEGAIPEGEPECYDGYVDNYNGGCNSSPFIWQSINCGDTICGTSGVYDANYYRDTDWFRVEVGDGDLTWTVVAEFPLLIFIIDAGTENCSDYTILGSLVVPKCDTASLSFYVTAGVYWVLVMPSDWGNYPCGDQSEYVAWLDCVPFGPQMAVDPASMYPVLNPSGDCSTADEDLIISSVGGEDLTYSIAENPPVDWMELSSYSGTIPPGNSHTLTVSFDAGGMTPGDYYCDLEIDHNDPSLPDPYVVAVHLEVELAPEIDVPPRVWQPVNPQCIMDVPFRIGNAGEGALDFEISIQKNPPPLGAGGKSSVREALEALGRAGGANPNLTPKEAFKTVGAERSKIEYYSTGQSEGLLLSGGAGKQANILLVDDDGGLPGGTYYDIEDIFMDALDDNGFAYDYYVVDWIDPQSPGPDLATMQNYGCVIWFTGETWGYYGDDTFTPTDEDNVGAYLDGGGNLFLSAQDYLWDMYPSAGSFSPGQFPYDYLHLASVSQDVWNDPYTAIGVAGSVAEGMQFDCLRFTDNPDVPLWTDDLTGQAGAVDVFNVLGGVSAIQYDAGTFKVVFTTTAFPGLVDGSPSYRADLMASIIDWFGCVGAPCPFTAYPEEGTVPAESFFDVTLTYDGTLFTECEDETLTCYMVITSNDCDEPILTVPVHAMSARGDVGGDCKMTAHGDCIINSADVVFLIDYVFKGGLAPDPYCMGDVDRDGDVDGDDCLYLISYLFLGGPPPEIPAAPEADDQTIEMIRPIKQAPIERK
ncbi:hypothetical protein AMJ44_09080 [candidate division WOR-1 bacterium DG_54_3]|uniref:T9SS-like galactose binding domain-containing protein n=1 Tax=candidate division WOR-1 bacterium DG_54_3 TaxID=1703775 RepID=A0A0S7XU87_UNCSA|nr:MAG: hypothetical protein AMJ44_09080 [candidate division WOR-1 bacterium DG_54_3]